MTLPHRDSPDIHLVIATAEENRLQQQVNSEEWRGPLSLEAYFRREELLSNQELTKDGGLTGWLLIHQPESGASRRVLCGCETIFKKALVARNGRVEDVVSYGVASVYTAAENRGKGYAGRMMSMLGERLKSWETEKGKPCLFSVLYSDIGKDFYAARGWRPFPSSHVALPPSSKAVRSSSVRMLKNEDIPALCAEDERVIRIRLSQAGSEMKTTVALIPDQQTIRWHHAREEFVGKEILGKTPVVKGAMIGDTPGSRVWCYWMRVWLRSGARTEANASLNTLHILRLVVEDVDFSDLSPASPANTANSTVAKAISHIFAAAQAEAAEWGMDEVKIWNPTSTTLAAAREIEPQTAVVQRETDSITSLRWYGGGDGEDVEWICNEKYGWC